MNEPDIVVTITPSEGPGRRLRIARENKNLDIDAVAAMLHLS